MACLPEWRRGGGWGLCREHGGLRDGMDGRGKSGFRGSDAEGDIV